MDEPTTEPTQAPSLFTKKRLILLAVAFVAGFLILITFAFGRKQEKPEETSSYTVSNLPLVDQSDVVLNNVNEYRSSLACLVRILYHLDLFSVDLLSNEFAAETTAMLINFIKGMEVNRAADISKISRQISWQSVYVRDHPRQIFHHTEIFKGIEEDFLVKYRTADSNRKDIHAYLPNDEGILQDVKNGPMYKAIAMMLTNDRTQPNIMTGSHSVYLRHVTQNTWTRFNDHGQVKVDKEWIDDKKVEKDINTADIKDLGFQFIVYQRILQ